MRTIEDLIMKDEVDKLFSELSDIKVALARITSEARASEDGFKEAIFLVRKKLDKVDHILSGNGKEGMVVRLDRLEQAEKARTWNIRLIWGAVAGVIMKIVSDLL